MLKNPTTLAIRSVDTAENEPPKVSSELGGQNGSVRGHVRSLVGAASRRAPGSAAAVARCSRCSQREGGAGPRCTCLLFLHDGCNFRSAPRTPHGLKNSEIYDEISTSYTLIIQDLQLFDDL